MAAKGARYSATEKAELVAEIMKMHSARISIPQIAKNMDLHHQTVYTWIQQQYQAISAPIVEQERKKDLGLLEQAIELCWSRIQKGYGPVATFTDLDRLLSRRAKLLGLDSPVQIEASISSEPINIELQERLNEVKMKNAVLEQQLHQLTE